ncbi:MAG: hypothetical protein QM541_08975 [Flavobacterium sp.]|nr:hypothetical protein [Flavobacterium sp.]
MENKPLDIKFQMRISALSTLKFAIYDIENFGLIKNKAIEYESQFNIKILEESNEIAIETTVKLKNLELDDYLAEIKVLMKFTFLPFDTIVQKSNGGYQIPDAIVLNLFNIISGTLRGILFEKLRGSVLQNEIFPLIDVKNLLSSAQYSIN